MNVAIHCFGTMLKGGREGYTSHKSVSLARFPQNLQNLYRISGLRYLLKFCGVKLRELGYSQISAPLSAKLRQTPKSYRGTSTCWTPSITMPSLVGLGFQAPPGRTKMLSFCLSVCLSVNHAVERQSLCAWFRHECVGAQKWFRCRWIGEFVCASVFNFEGLEKRLGLGLARSRSRLVAKIRRLVSVSSNCRKV